MAWASSKSQSQPMNQLEQRQVLYGLTTGWHCNQWTSSDDRVRGGQSQSYLESSGAGVCFRGTLDIEALGGAGFASQRDAGPDQHWDLSPFSGVEVSIDPSQSDGKLYTLILKDEILPRDPDTGRERSTISWEFNFTVSRCRPEAPSRSSPSDTSGFFVPWDRFKPTFRGKGCDDPRSLDLSDVKGVSIMIRSFFGSQQGDFRLRILTIVATSSPELPELAPAVAGNPHEHGGDATGPRPSPDETRGGEPTYVGGGLGGKI
ncbi:hypothetical protein A1O7_06480 [Cladophialophora yegresii CBS 114405]|uniref:NADH:ubiquinone oxidoreductase intermediate-associated protein 30 domain-containing protein n=1 Tax=Cladophialophora yegresii CBS 114405 TaxID=1182544 RepID=W9WKR2_9EURO|nr:uncharacterized protein A1O7_06480 [Cladophialophora yegresii CBS 114405]EXJ59049.1 hypothetical protein A1O7_06480 [Cladophialophora yegresii CBS 114405]